MAWGEDHDEEFSLMEDEEQLETPTEDHCMLLIDARPSMLKPGVDGGKSPLVASLEAAQAVLRRIIIQGGGGQRNKVGIMLFGAEQEPEVEDEDEKEEKEETSAFGGGGGLGGSNAVGGQHFMLQPLAPPTARRIKQLERLCKPHVDAAAQLRLRWPEVEAKEEDGGLGLGIGGTSPMSRALRTSLRTLETGSCKVDRDAKRIWLFTDEDDPSSAGGGGAGAAGKAADPVRQGIKDALDSRAEVRLFYFPPPAPGAKGGYRAFREEAFYGPLLAKQELDHAQWEAGAEEWDDEDEEGGSKLVDAMAGGIERLKEEAGKRAMRKRRYARMALHLSAPGSAATATKAAMSLQVALYRTVQPARKPAPLQLAAATNRRLVAATRYLSDTLVKYVDLELEARQALPFTGGDHEAPGALLLDWAKADFEATKRAGRGEQGIHLLGFVSAAELAWELSVGGATLLYPEESLLKGCTRAFIALREAMLQRKVMALVRFHATPRSEPRMAVLLAHPDSPGLELVKLPFLDDVRSVVVSVNAKGPAGANGAALTPSCATVAAAAAVMRAVLPREEDFKPHEVLHNPALVKFYSVLQALALEEGPDVDAKEMDKTLVQWEKDERAQVTLQRAAPALEAWEAAVSEECQGYVIAGGGSMKAAAGGGGKKKRKVEEDAEEEDEWGDGAAAEGKGKKNAKKGGGKKRNAAADEEEDGGDEEEGDTVDAVRAQIADGSIHGLTVPELKVLCRKLGLPVSGKKADLVTRLQH